SVHCATPSIRAGAPQRGGCIRRSRTGVPPATRGSGPVRLHLNRYSHSTHRCNTGQRIGSDVPHNQWPLPWYPELLWTKVLQEIGACRLFLPVPLASSDACSCWMFQRASKSENLFVSSNTNVRGMTRNQGKERLSFHKQS